MDSFSRLATDVGHVGTGQTMLVVAAAILLVPSVIGPLGMIGARDSGALRSQVSRIGPWDPLIGAPQFGVPRYHVTTTALAPSRTPSYQSGTPVWLAYDPADQSFWVATLPSSVDIIPANATYNLTAAVPVGLDPFDVAVDPAANEVFVTDSGSNNVSVISDTTDQPVGSVNVGEAPMGVTFDPTDSELFVANELSNDVSVVSLSNLSVIATVSVGFSPVGVAFDPATDRVFVADSGSYAISAIDASTDRVVATIPAGIDPDGVAVDNESDNVYVTNEGSSNVSVIHASTGAIVANIPVVVPGEGALLQGVAYDSSRNQVWIGAGYYYLAVLNASAEDIAAIFSTDPSGIALDPASDTMCFTNTYNSTFECLTAYAYSSAGTASVTFSETGLPVGTSWTVSQSGGPGLTSNSTSVQFEVCRWCILFGVSIVFVVSATGGYVAAIPNPVVSPAYSGSNNLTVNVTFNPGAAEFPVDFGESGLAVGLGWSVIVNGSVQESSTTKISASAPNGTYPYLPSAIPDYQSDTPNGNFVVDGAAVLVPINYTFYPAAYNVTLLEQGLPEGAPWFVNFTSEPTGVAFPGLGAITASAAVVGLPDGTYSYTAATALPGYSGEQDGSFSEFEGLPTQISVTFRQVNYSLVFKESGLPTGTSWSVALSAIPGGSPRSVSSTSSQLVFSATDGEYAFRVGDTLGFAASPANGNVTVSGTATYATTINFTSTAAYPATFHESGLPNGSGWAVAIGSQFESSLTSNVTLEEPNGTYGYVIQAVAGYTTSYSGYVTVAGHPALVEVQFLPQTYPVVVVEVGLPSGSIWNVTVTNSISGAHQTFSSNGSSILFYLPNGTYSISVSVPSGYSAVVSAPTFTVDGSSLAAPSVQAIASQSTSGGNSGTSYFGVPTWYWVVLIAVTAGLVMLSLRVIVGRRKAH